MLQVNDFQSVLRGKTVCVTGHTGFTGGWLVRWLSLLGCKVVGISLPPITTPNLFTSGNIETLCEKSHIGDITDYDWLLPHIQNSGADILFHLAAQPLVRKSYKDPLETFAANVMGTANVLEAARYTDTLKAAVIITTDKVYDNKEREEPYHEDEALGGKDPYSASKACAELVVASYQKTLSQMGNGIAIASVRGGNIVGGGDWSEDRLIPDIYRAVVAETTLNIRYPKATRPWQHVLTACHGYMAVGAALLETPDDIIGSWNVGPADLRGYTVEEIVEKFTAVWTKPNVDFETDQPPEAMNLLVDTAKIKAKLGVLSPWDIEAVIENTALWYRDFAASGGNAAALMETDIASYRGQISGRP